MTWMKRPAASLFGLWLPAGNKVSYYSDIFPFAPCFEGWAFQVNKHYNQLLGFNLRLS